MSDYYRAGSSFEDKRKEISSGGVSIDEDDAFERPANGQKLFTFFSSMPYRWSLACLFSGTKIGFFVCSFSTIRLREDGSIPSTEFLQSCLAMASIFDLMGSTAFAPVKMDLNGNIRVLRDCSCAEEKCHCFVRN